MTIATQPYKGTRDFYPEDKRKQKYMFGVMRTVAERFGYVEYDAPILEPLEIYASKTSDEIVNEQTYIFADRGGRQVVLRPEMTPSVSRMVAGKRQELSYPLRWYSIPNVWRYERPQRGRLREHWQLNVDLFGLPGIEADHEIILVADEIMQTFGAKRDAYTIKINSRKLINSFMHEDLQLDATQIPTLIRLIDRMHKLDHAEFVGQADALFSPSQRDAGASKKLFEFLKIETIDELPEALSSHESIEQLRKLLKLLKKSFISNVQFDPTLMRGFDYYTDIVFEVFDTDPENNRSMFGGGRYDGLVGQFGVESIPTVGFGMGDVTLQNFLESHNLMPVQRTETDVVAILVGDVYEQALSVVAELREMGVNVAVDSSNRKVEKQIKSAEKCGINYVLFIGDKELQDEQYSLKNLQSGNEERHGIQRIVSIIKDFRKS